MGGLAGERESGRFSRRERVGGLAEVGVGERETSQRERESGGGRVWEREGGRREREREREIEGLS